MPTKIAEYVYVRDETGYLFVAITVPTELRKFLKGGPKAKLSRSLGAPPPLSGEAKRKAIQTIAEFQSLIEDARKHYLAAQERDLADSAERETRRYLQSVGIYQPGDYIHHGEDDGAPSPKQTSLVDLISFAAAGWPNPETSEQTLEVAVQRVKNSGDSLRQLTYLEQYISVESARLDAARALLDRLKVPVTPQLSTTLDSTMTVTRLLEKFLSDHPKTSDTERQYRTAVSLYLSNQDNKPVHNVTRNDALAFRNYLHGRDDLALGTCDQRLKKIRSLFHFATKELEVLSKNPFDGVNVDEKAKSQHGNELDRSNVTPEHININLVEIIPLFSKEDSLHWPYLIAFFTGARIEEICGLKLDEIGERWGVNCFHIRQRPEDNRTVKTEEARYTPIHTFLWNNLGLKYFVEFRRQNGETMLFDFKKWKGKFYSGKFSHKMTELRKRIKQDRNCDLKDQHALRHNLTTLLRNAGVHDEWRCLIVGHSYGSKANAGYGVNDGTLTHINEALHRIDLAPFDFSKLY